MKSILLTSTALVAFAGAASAEITWSGSATLGYNDELITPRTSTVTVTGFTTSTAGAATTTTTTTTVSSDSEGFYWDANIAVTFSQELDNGLTAGATFNFDIADDNLGEDLSAGDYVLYVTSEMASLYYGDTLQAAQTHWSSAGDMETDGFSETDGETVLRGDITYSGISASVSYIVEPAGLSDAQIAAGVADGGGTFAFSGVNQLDDLNQLSIGVAGDVGQFSFALAYQEKASIFLDINSRSNGDFNPNEIFGVSVGGSFVGADVTLAYSQSEDLAGVSEHSTGLRVAYPVGPVTLTAYYVDESAAAGDNWGINAAYANGPFAVTLDYQDDQGTEKVGLEGSYDVGNGLIVYAGYLTESGTADNYYVAGELSLGGGASLQISYADDGGDEAPDDDDIGTNDYQVGTTVEVSFEF